MIDAELDQLLSVSCLQRVDDRMVFVRGRASMRRITKRAVPDRVRGNRIASDRFRKFRITRRGKKGLMKLVVQMKEPEEFVGAGYPAMLGGKALQG